MLDLQGLNAQDLQGLSPSSLAEVAAQMLTRIGEQSKFIGEQGRQLDERNKQITEQAQAIKFKDVKIEHRPPSQQGRLFWTWRSLATMRRHCRIRATYA